ncbi:hypothetical protein HF521_006251 [Silurus meridionalis]|uniref:Sushi domain-containing protein n=1 Tax=Silurus meridionalis TaxID=175797 RepID=A0A8T0ASR9_SILME|nr:hypothetical protein HF521_006251 [Silurus meridionalis]
MSHYMIIFCSLLLTAVDVRAQCDRPSVGENRVLADDVDQQSFSDGSVLKFKCATGYVTLSGSKSITCTGNQWSDLELRCKKRSCGNPGEINNGRYQIPPEGGILFGATITATCNDGFMLVGYAKRNCLANGWDGRAPVCEEVKCLPPPSIKDGTFEPMEDFYNYNEVVTYSCDSGVHLIGTSELSCSNDGTFQPAPPRCTAVLCDRPEIPHAVRIEGKSPPYKLGNFVRYKCEKGYKMEGSNLIVCKENGWDPSLPQCTVITCSNPPNITNGVFNPSKESYMIEEKVTYDCVEGFKLYGSPTISCTDNGQFEKFLPECRPIICDSPLIPYSVIDGSPPYTYNSVIKIKCNKGYKLEGSESLTCGNDGWISALPRCIPLTCDAPSITDAYIVKGKAASYTYAMSIQVKCSKGYTMTGSDTLSCDENGWNPPPPKCNIVTCVQPPEINNGQVTLVQSVYKYGQTVTYLCAEKFSIEGAATISCTEYGTFQDPPQCKEVSAPLTMPTGVIALLGSLGVVVFSGLVFGGLFGGYRYYQKKEKSKKSTHGSKPETCSLSVNKILTCQ